MKYCNNLCRRGEWKNKFGYCNCGICEIVMTYDERHHTSKSWKYVQNYANLNETSSDKRYNYFNEWHDHDEILAHCCFIVVWRSSDRLSSALFISHAHQAIMYPIYVLIQIVSCCRFRFACICAVAFIRRFHTCPIPKSANWQHWLRRAISFSCRRLQSGTMVRMRINDETGHRNTQNISRNTRRMPFTVSDSLSADQHYFRKLSETILLWPCRPEVRMPCCMLQRQARFAGRHCSGCTTGGRIQ